MRVLSSHFLLYCVCWCQIAEAGNILAIFPHFGYSHFKVIQPILLALAQRGHKVTVLSYVKTQTQEQQAHHNYEELLIKNDAHQLNTTINVANFGQYTPTRSFFIMLREFFALHNEGQRTCELLYSSIHVKNVLERHQLTPYDLLITEYFNSDCVLGIAHLLQKPVVAVSTSALMPWYYDRINLPDTPSYVQSEFIGFPEQLNWLERLINFIQVKLLKLFYRVHTNADDNALIKKYLAINVDVNAVAHRQTAYILVNQHYTLMGSRPHTRQLIEIGGVHINETQIVKPLPAFILQFLAAHAAVGVIFISWGSMLRAASIQRDKLNAIVETLQKLPYGVIWKWELDEPPIVDEHFLFVKWAPQLALLCHSNVKLFWSHGGLLGTTEALHCGKPMLIMPIYGDQFLNAYAVSNRGMGLQISYINDINNVSLKKLFHEVLQPHYAQRAKQLSLLFRERAQTPLQRSVWSVEYIIKYGAVAVELLQNKATELHWFIYYSYDSIVLLIVVVYLMLWHMRRIWQLLCTISGNKLLTKSKIN